MKPVSFSGLQLYKNCPSSFKRRYIDKEVVPPGDGVASPAALRGSAIHSNLDQYISGESDVLHEDCAHLKDFLLALREDKAVPEVRWALDNLWKSVDFMSPDAAIRGIVDAILVKPPVAYVYEWKTGKRYGDHGLQRALYGMALLCRHSHINEVTVITTYIDLGKNDMSTYDRESLRGYQWLWETRIAEVWGDDEYLPTPNWKCKYCVYNTDNGGQCGAGAGR